MSSHKVIIGIIVVAIVIATVFSFSYKSLQTAIQDYQYIENDQVAVVDEVNITLSRNLHVVINDGFKASTPP